ncbi:hypothetical protein ColKHC_02514 [Colletotrichum higginsianum]|nr:hypothetical protein ColKHC_02514 [Colletotrichum higginsianum]
MPIATNIDNSTTIPVRLPAPTSNRQPPQVLSPDHLSNIRHRGCRTGHQCRPGLLNCCGAIVVVVFVVVHRRPDLGVIHHHHHLLFLQRCLAVHAGRDDIVTYGPFRQSGNLPDVRSFDYHASTLGTGAVTLPNVEWSVKLDDFIPYFNELLFNISLYHSHFNEPAFIWHKQRNVFSAFFPLFDMGLDFRFNVEHRWTEHFHLYHERLVDAGANGLRRRDCRRHWRRRRRSRPTDGNGDFHG